jgi:hypothetical protein
VGIWWRRVAPVVGSRLPRSPMPLAALGEWHRGRPTTGTGLGAIGMRRSRAGCRKSACAGMTLRWAGFCSKIRGWGLSMHPLTLNGYGYCVNDPDGKLPLLAVVAIGFISGAIAGAVTEIIVQAIDDKPGVNWGDVGESAVVGGVAGGIAGPVGGKLVRPVGKYCARRFFGPGPGGKNTRLGGDIAEAIGSDTAGDVVGAVGSQVDLPPGGSGGQPDPPPIIQTPGAFMRYPGNWVYN